MIVLFMVSAGMFQCRPEDELFDFDFTGGLEFSTDTVLFDTIFTGVGSITKRFKIYNRHAKALRIDRVQLAGGAGSPYKIYVSGQENTDYHDLEILGKDSMLVLIEAFIDPKDENMPYLVADSMIFETNGKSQQVKLVAWGQDANYLGNEVLDCDITWTKERPYVIYGSIVIDSLCQLTVQKGTKIFCAKGAFIYAKGNIVAQGTAEERIVFRNERLDPAFENIPGQWGGIFLLPGSHGNWMEFTNIRNAQYGIRLGSPDQDTIPDIVMINMIIENMSNAGILAFTSDLYAENVLVNNCIEFNCGNIAGGNYSYRHCTFGNYQFDFNRQNPSFYISDNILLNDNSTIVEDISVEISNCIVEGNLKDELLIDLGGGADYSFAFTHSMFRSTIEGLDTLGNILNQDPAFIDPARHNFRLDTLSPAKDRGVFIGVLTDLDNKTRDAMPDMGAYERIEK
ncbi:MAG: right-handed parallel beta-helix repeat-containing protein [Cyclobacteriaceae bacterium]|nr:right-handed parallel beta-helix repeat-containing protein [Cyclobacteriaceae bacterium]